MEVDNTGEMFVTGIIDIETTCNECGAEFLEPEDLDLHFKQMHAIKSPSETLNAKNKCQFCTYQYVDLSEYASHIMTSHLTDLEGRVCLYCKRITNPDSLAEHKNKHVTDALDKYSCSVCSTRFSSIEDLELHQESKHRHEYGSISIRSVLPYLCSLMKVDPEQLFSALNDTTQLTCVNCKFTSDSKEIYKNHVLEKQCASFTCDICSSTFKLKFQLAKHMYSHSVKKADGKRKKGFTMKYGACNRCGIAFESLKEKNNHVGCNSNMPNIMKCPHCTRVVVGQRVLDKHIEQVHNNFDKFKYPCSYCIARYKHPRPLFGHIFKHHPEVEPFRCKLCDLKFRKRSKFSIHIKMEHNSIGYVKHDERLNVEFTDEKPPPIKHEYYDDDSNEEEIKEEKKPFKKRVKPFQGKLLKKYMKKEKEIDSDDEPLLGLRTRCRMKKITKLSLKRPDKVKKTDSQFICWVCNKNCYTYQNFNHHLSLHEKNNKKRCIKCSKAFKSVKALKKHMEMAHSVSKLTETLKSILARKNQVTPKGKIESTMKKVEFTPSGVTATITPVSSSSNVRNFIENFVPEISDKPRESTNVVTNQSVTMKLVENATPRESFIKMTKLQLKPTQNFAQLKMPVKFKNRSYFDNCQVSIKEVPLAEEETAMEQEESYIDYSDELQMDQNVTEVEIENEIAVEMDPSCTVLPAKVRPPRYVRPYRKRNKKTKVPTVQIAVLTDEPPYYKIITVKENESQQLEANAPNENENETEENTISLPSGQRFRPINPYESLITDPSILEFKEKNTYYKPRIGNYREAVAKALAKVENL